MQGSLYSSAVERALAVAVTAHADQRRKGNGDPYVVHPLHMALVLERLGGDDVVIQAALLHDVAEDCEGWDLAGIAQLFGTEVAGVVAELTEDKACSWSERKRDAVEHVPQLSERALVVKAADVLHNLTSLARQLQERGDVEAVWSPFRGGRERTLAQHRRMVAALVERAPSALAKALRAELLGILGACGEPV